MATYNQLQVCSFLAKLLTICVCLFLVLAPLGAHSKLSFWSSSNEGNKGNTEGTITSRFLNKFHQHKSSGASFGAKMRTKISNLLAPKPYSLAELFEEEEREREKKAKLANSESERLSSDRSAVVETQEVPEDTQPDFSIKVEHTKPMKQALKRSKTVRENLNTTSTTQVTPEIVAETFIPEVIETATTEVPTTTTTTEAPTTTEEPTTTEVPTTTTTEVPETTTTPEPEVSSSAPRDFFEPLQVDDDAITEAPQEQEFTSRKPDGAQLFEVDESLGTSTVSPFYTPENSDAENDDFGYLEPLPGLIENRFKSSHDSERQVDEHDDEVKMNLTPVEADFTPLDTDNFVEQFGQKVAPIDEKPLDAVDEVKEEQDDSTWMDYLDNKKEDLESEEPEKIESDSQQEIITGRPQEQEASNAVDEQVQPADESDDLGQLSEKLKSSEEIHANEESADDGQQEATEETTKSFEEMDEVEVPTSTQVPAEEQQLETAEPIEVKNNPIKEKVNKKKRKKSNHMSRLKNKRRYNK